MSARWVCGAGLALAFLIPAWRAAVAAEEKSGPEQSVFEMREVSAFEKSDMQRGRLLTRGQYVECSTDPAKEVKAYPKLKSKRPLYGKFKFDVNPSTRDGIEFHFVLDESGEPAAREEKKGEGKDEAKKPETALLGSLKAALLGETEKKEERPAEAKPSRYDRLCFDLNRDLDLTNDPAIKPMKDPPWSALPPWSGTERAAFDYLDIKFDYGPGLGMRPFRVFPWFIMMDAGGQRSMMMFVATVAREGKIRIGQYEYNALLAQPYLIAGRFDRPTTALYLTPLGSQERIRYGGFEDEMLGTMRRIRGDLYTTTVTPLGDKLTVKPYRGDFGAFKIGPGGRDIKDKDIGLQGSLRSETTGLNVGPDTTGGFHIKAAECEVPVGDYLPSYLMIEYGRFQINLSDNYHSDGKPRDMERHRLYKISIRKDKPFVLDFSTKPEVIFASPGKDKTFKPGDEIRVAAVLVDPALDIMIRGLQDTKRTQKETMQLGSGRESTYERPLSLDPLVTITDASGKTVAEGKMPFG